MTDQIDHRYLGALRFVDRVTGGAVSGMISLDAPGVSVFRNRSGLYVIAAAPRFEKYVAAFDNPKPPANSPRPITFTCSDPSGRYLPRMITVQLPRDPDPTKRDNPASLFQPVTVKLYPSPRAEVGVNWSLIRVSLTRTTNKRPIRGALLRVVRDSDQAVLGSGFTDDDGEALVAIAGIPVTDFAVGGPGGAATGPVVVTQVPATLEMSVNPAAGWPCNCEEVEQQHPGFVKATEPVTLRTGKSERVAVSITV